MLPELYLHGLAKGDFELALRRLLGDGAPLSRSSIERLKASWQLERGRVEEPGPVGTGDRLGRRFVRQGRH